MPERIDLGPLDDHRDAAQRAVAALAGGGLVGLAGGGSPALLASATSPAALRLFAEVKPSSARERAGPALLLSDPAALLDWAEPRSEAARRLPGRVWPGPVRLACVPSGDGLWRHLPPEARTTLLDEGGRATFQVPDEPLVRSILGLMAGPALLIEADGGAISGLFDLAALVIDEIPPVEGRRATVVRLDDDGWAVARPGVVAESTIRELVGTILLFVCTGNTCRSPMAAAHCRLLLARHFGCAVADLPTRGFTVESAGVGAAEGSRASAHAVTIARDASIALGLDPAEAGLGRHRSRPVTAQLVRRADQILTMTWDHLDALLDYFPEAADRVRLLDPTGMDIPDPYGSSEEVYGETSRFIVRALNDLLTPILETRLGPDVPPP